MESENFTVSEETVMCAFDYAIGRTTYIVGSVVRDISLNLGVLSQNSRQSMIRKITTMKQDGTLGHPQDVAQWEGLLEELNELEAEARP